MENAEEPDDPEHIKLAECTQHSRTADLETQLHKIDDWTKEDVRQWLVDVVKIPQKYADILYNEDVSGACLLSFDKKDLIDLGWKHGPAVQIIKKVSELKMPSEMFRSRAIHDDTDALLGTSTTEHYQQDKATVEKPTSTSAELEIHPRLSIQENSDGRAVEHTLSWASEEITKGGRQELLHDTQNLQKEEALILENLNDKKGHGVRSPQSKTLLPHSTKATSAKNVWMETKEHVGQGNFSETSLETSNNCVKRVCKPRPFDEISTSFVYIQNELLPPETGPSNLVDPVHEYKLMANTENASEKDILKKFTDEVFRFAAACMNSRTNGTIHFGVGDKPHYEHGQIIGLEVTSPDKYVDEFDKRLKDHFEENTNIAKTCIRPPKFFQVKCPDNINTDKWIIEVDVVPNYSETLETLFYTVTINEEEKKKCKTESLFIRSGANTINILADKNPRSVQEKMKKVTDDVKTWALSRKSAEERETPSIRQSSQGQRLKQLITHGRDTLENALQFIVITNKCHVSQLEHLKFLKELKLFVVLDFDPESQKNGTCSYYRKDRMANIHYPRLYNTTDNTISTIISKLNLFKQTSWVFCNGQVNETEADMPFSDGEWLKKRATEVSEMISFICKPDIISKDKLVVVFLLHSAVNDISSPITETFCAIYQKLEGDDNMLCICKDLTVFEQWKHVVQTRCKIDITSKCIYELSLNEINCTIQKTREPQTSSVNRYLPSTGSSSVLLTKKDEAQMTVLEILAENECENTEIETMDSFKQFKNKIEEDFYRGGQVRWWNFYLSERPGSIPFITRDKYEELHNLITPTEGHSSPCVTINLFHHPGCGGTTLAMHVLWNLRRKFRCAVLKNNLAQSSEIAVQVTQLLTYGKEEPSTYTPVLLLVDNWDDVEDLQRCILCAAHEKKKQESLMVIILNCERSQFPSESSRKSRIDNVFITNKLSTKEQGFFQMKLKELKGHHEKPETFYAFMIMTNDFSEKYIENLVCNTLKDLDVSTKEGQLLSFLALLNTYVHGSCISLSLCEELAGVKNLWKQETLEEKMNPYSTLLISFNVEECGTYQAVRFLHQMIAQNCLKVLISKHNLKLSEITTNLLHCNQLYKSGMGKDVLIQNILSMLITRQRKELGDDKDTLFSPLIEEMPLAESKEVLTFATKKFDKNATLPQALARHFYLKEKDFTSALQWAQDARQKESNSYIADTLGQVYKGHLKLMYETEQTNELTPEELEKCLQLAVKATMAFKDSQDLAKKDDQMDLLDQPMRKRQRTYNTSGYVGEIDVAMIIFDILEKIFRKHDGYQWETLLHFLKNSTSLHSFRKTDQRTAEFIPKLINHEKYLFSLKPRMKEIFEFFENYFTYLKPRSIERETAEDRNKRKVSELFKKYVKLFCQSGEEKEIERASQPNLSLSQKLEDYRCYLEEKRANTFAGLLQCLTEKNGSQMELILKKWQFISENSKNYINQVNFILANIVLYCIKPKSPLLKKFKELLDLLNVVLQEKGTYSDCTEAYYLAMLLLWPGKESKMDNSTLSKNICTYVTSTKKSFHRRFSHLFPAKSAIAHFYHGKSKELKRVIHKAKLDQVVAKEKHPNIHQLWQSGAIWREPEVQNLLQRVKGKTENGIIYIHYGGNLRIPVRPVYLGGLRSGCSMEEVSFFLGFTMEGPVAYDIKYTTDL